MTALGFLHGGGAKSFKTLHHGGAHGHAVTPHGHAGGFKTFSNHHHGVSVKSAKAVPGTNPLLLALSPLDLFSYAVGAGAVGLLLEKLVAPGLLIWLAIAGALFFNFGIVKRLMYFALRFETKPSEGLEGMIAHKAEAMTNFDKDGRGLVSLTFDDQTTQVLALLDPAELEQGIRICKGDEVVVLEVDPVRNTCRVTRELST